jgi:hypothetical protein
MATHRIGNGLAYGYAGDSGPLPGERVGAAANRTRGANEGRAQTPQQGIKATLARGHGDEPHRGSRAWAPTAPVAPPLREQIGSWQRGTATWAGRPISRWSRCGRCNEDGTEIWITRIL